MCEIPVFYATTEGQTRRIAERLATLFKEHGLASAAIDVESERAALFNWRPVRAVLLGASLHMDGTSQALRASSARINTSSRRIPRRSSR